MDWLLFCNDTTGLPCTDATPWFSWQFSGSSVPISWRVQVFDHTNTVLWDTETIIPAGTHLVYNGQPLSSMTRYFWQVHANIDGKIVKSPICSFLTGVLYLTDWKGAQWIEAASEIASPLFKRSFTLTEAQAQNGVISICGLGLYELYCNGTKVSEDLLTPAQTDYAPVQYLNLQYPFSGETRKSAFYQTYDLSGYLHEGPNTITVWLGNGFYRQRERLVEGTFDYGNLSLLCCIRCLEKTIVSDENWLTIGSPILYNNFFIANRLQSRSFQGFRGCRCLARSFRLLPQRRQRYR
jgi:alpha-L-rhamnosidase